MAREWFVVPQDGSGTEEDPFFPKYSDDDRAEFIGWVDIDIPPSLNLVLQGVRFIALVEASQSDLDLLAAQTDTYVISYDGDFAPREVANFLNQHTDVIAPNDHGIRELLPLTPREWASWILGDGAILE